MTWLLDLENCEGTDEMNELEDRIITEARVQREEGLDELKRIEERDVRILKTRLCYLRRLLGIDADTIRSDINLSHPSRGQWNRGPSGGPSSRSVARRGTKRCGGDLVRAQASFRKNLDADQLGQEGDRDGLFRRPDVSLLHVVVIPPGHYRHYAPPSYRHSRGYAAASDVSIRIWTMKERVAEVRCIDLSSGEARCLDPRSLPLIMYPDIGAVRRAITKYQSGSFLPSVREQMEFALSAGDTTPLEYLVVLEEQVVNDHTDCWILRPGIYDSGSFESMGVMGVMETLRANGWPPHMSVQFDELMTAIAYAGLHHVIPVATGGDYELEMARNGVIKCEYRIEAYYDPALVEDRTDEHGEAVRQVTYVSSSRNSTLVWRGRLHQGFEDAPNEALRQVEEVIIPEVEMRAMVPYEVGQVVAAVSMRVLEGRMSDSEDDEEQEFSPQQGLFEV